jgi:hypothetical protein
MCSLFLQMPQVSFPNEKASMCDVRSGDSQSFAILGLHARDVGSKASGKSNGIESGMEFEQKNFIYNMQWEGSDALHAAGINEQVDAALVWRLSSESFAVEGNLAAKKEEQIATGLQALQAFTYMPQGSNIRAALRGDSRPHTSFGSVPLGCPEALASLIKVSATETSGTKFSTVLSDPSCNRSHQPVLVDEHGMQAVGSIASLPRLTRASR